MKFKITLAAIFLFQSVSLWAQDKPLKASKAGSIETSRQIPDSLKIEIPIDSDSTKNKNEIKLTKPVQYQRSFEESTLTFTDSLSRWRPYNNISELLFWEKSFWTFRTWSYIRGAFISNVNQIKPNYYLDGLKIRNPLGNQINPNLLPFRDLDELYQTKTGIYVFSKQVKQTQPYTYLDVEETGFGYTNVYGSLILPVSKQQGLEFSLWNRSEDGEFANSSALARHLTAKYHYQINDFQKIQFSTQYIINKMGENDGYLVEPIGLFAYDQFRSLANRNKAYSSMRNNLYRIDFLDEKSTWFKQSTLFLNLNRRFVKAPLETPSVVITSPSDTVDLGYRELGIQTASSFKTDWVSMNYLLRSSVIKSNQNDLINPIQRPLNGLIWTETGIESDVTFPFWNGKSKLAQSFTLNSLVGLSGFITPTIQIKTGTQSEFEFHITSELNQQPIYSKKWNSLTLSGSELSATYGLSGGLKWKWGNNRWNVEAALNSGYKSGDYAISGNTFILTKQYMFGNAVLSTGLSLGKFSAKNELTFSAFRGDGSFWGNTNILWNRSMIAHEDYWFSRAAFIRNSFQLLMSPFAFPSTQYQIFTDDWIPSLNGEQIPMFAKLDYEMVARVRQLFISVRWENLTQGLFQNGYFETYPNPMFSRRLRFGIKVYFIN